MKTILTLLFLAISSYPLFAQTPLTIEGTIVNNKLPRYADVTIVKSGKPAATIVLPLKPSAEEKISADKFQYYVKKITGATLPLSTQGSQSEGNVILIGRQQGTIGLRQRMQASNAPEESSIVNADNKTVRIIGIDES